MGILASGAFVLQLDSESDPPRGRLSGSIEQVLSGRSIHFDSTESLLAFITETLARHAQPAPAAADK